MVKCWICKKKMEPGNGTFFKVPKDEKRRQQWSEICRTQFAPTARICADHFSPTQIITSGRQPLLLPIAVPIVQTLQKNELIKGREEWLRIVGVEPKNKNLFICSIHFSEGNVFGNKVSRYAKPDRNLPPFVKSKPKTRYMHGKEFLESLNYYSLNKHSDRKRNVLFKASKQILNNKANPAQQKIHSGQINSTSELADIQYADEDVVEEEIVTVEEEVVTENEKHHNDVAEGDDSIIIDMHGKEYLECLNDYSLNKHSDRKRNVLFKAPKQILNNKANPAQQKLHSEQINSTSELSDIQYADEDVVEEEAVTENEKHHNDVAEGNESIIIEDFEMHPDSSKDTIIKGRYVQLKDYLVVSYTTPTKLSLKQQVDSLNAKFDKQKRILKLIKSKNLRLSQQLYKYRKLAKKLKKDLGNKNYRLKNSNNNISNKRKVKNVNAFPKFYRRLFHKNVSLI